LIFFLLIPTLSTNPKLVNVETIELLEITIDEHYEKIDRVIDSHIKNLRQKIDMNSSDLKIIQTVYGVGYKLGI